MSDESINELRDNVIELHNSLNALLKTQAHIISAENGILKELVYISAGMRVERNDAKQWRQLVSAAVCGIAAWVWFR